MNPENNEFLSWDSSFMAEESSFKLFQPGDYPFTVTNMERKIYDGKSDKIPNGAPYAEVSMEFTGPEGTTTVTDRLYLMKNWQWKLTQFFTGIGQAPVVGQPFQPNWGMVMGSKGTATLEINTYTSKGEERKNNRIKAYLEPANNNPVQNQKPQQQPNNWSPGGGQVNNQQPPVQNQQQNNGFQTGAF